MWPFSKSPEQKQKQIVNEAAKELEQIIVNSSLANNQLQQFSRGRLSNSLSRYISGNYDFSDDLHQIFCDFGYPNELRFENFWNMYRRFGVAKCVVNTMPEACWMTHPEIKGSDAFNSELDKLIKKTRLWNRMKGLDKRQRVGAYAGAYIEVKDGLDPREPMQRLTGGLANIVNIKPIYEGQLFINEYYPNGDPISYQYIPNYSGTRNPNDIQTIEIHPSRLVVWSEGADDGSIYGISELEAIFNDMMDMRKISGAGAEGAYQNSRAIPVFTSEGGFQAPKDTGNADPAQNPKLAFDNTIEDFLNKFRKRLVLNGITPHWNNTQIPNPKEVYQTALNNVAAGSGLPQAWITGQITGVLAGNKDFAKIMMDANSRRVNFLDEAIAMFVDWFIKYGVLPNSDYEIEWDDLMAASDEDKIKLALEMTKANREEYMSGGTRVFSTEEIREVAGFEIDIEINPDDLPNEMEDLTDELDEPEEA